MEMEILRGMLDQRNIEWTNASDIWISRTWFTINGNKWSVISGKFSYGGPEGFLELVTNSVNDGDPIGWLTADEVMAYVDEAR